MKKITPLKSIRAKCLDCCAGQPSEVRRCEIADCPLHTYRFGHNPRRKGLGALNRAFAKNSALSKEKLTGNAISEEGGENCANRTQ